MTRYRERYTDSDGCIDMGMYTIRITEEETKDMGMYTARTQKPVRNKRVMINEKNGDCRVLEDRVDSSDDEMFMPDFDGP